MVHRKYILPGSGHERVGVCKKEFNPRVEVRGLTKENIWKKVEQRALSNWRLLLNCATFYLQPPGLWREGGGGYAVKEKEEAVKPGSPQEKHPPTPTVHSVYP